VSCLSLFGKYCVPAISGVGWQYRGSIASIALAVGERAIRKEGGGGQSCYENFKPSGLFCLSVGGRSDVSVHV